MQAVDAWIDLLMDRLTHECMHFLNACVSYANRYTQRKRKRRIGLAHPTRRLKTKRGVEEIHQIHL
jgi:hypothetical protein